MEERCKHTQTKYTENFVTLIKREANTQIDTAFL